MSRKIHAQRNERLSRSINKEGIYMDWVVTTAFYSALHYVNHELFPLVESRREYPNLDSFYNSFSSNKESKHRVLVKLVFENLNDIGYNYKWLHDTSMVSRYIDYGVSDKIAERALKYLDYIKTCLTK